MTEPQDDLRTRLARMVEDRRKSLSLSISRAAREAGIDRGTWTGLERGSRQTEEYNYAGIERALKWASGSIDDIVAGGEPTVQQAAAAEPAPAGREPESMSPRSKAIIRVMQSERVPEEEKPRIVAILLADQAAEEQRRLALAEELMRPWEQAS